MCVRDNCLSMTCKSKVMEKLVLKIHRGENSASPSLHRMCVGMSAVWCWSVWLWIWLFPPAVLLYLSLSLSLLHVSLPAAKWQILPGLNYYVLLMLQVTVGSAGVLCALNVLLCPSVFVCACEIKFKAGISFIFAKNVFLQSFEEGDFFLTYSHHVILS